MYTWCFPSQFNPSIRDTNLFLNETQICCSLIEIMRHLFFFLGQTFFFRFIGNFVFSVKIYFFNYSRELFFQLSITSSKIDRFQQFWLLNVCNNLQYQIQLWTIACWLLLIFDLAINTLSFNSAVSQVAKIFCCRVMIFWTKKSFSSQKRGLHNEYQLYMFNVYGITMYSYPLQLYCETLNIIKIFYSVFMTNWLHAEKSSV